MTYLNRLLQNIIFIIIGIFIMPIFYKKLGPEGLGVISYLESIVTVLSIIAGYGVARYGCREISKIKQNNEGEISIYRSLRKFTIWNHLIVNLVYFFIAYFLLDGVATVLVIISIISLNRNLINVDWYYEAKNKFNIVSIKNIVTKIISISVLFFYLDKESFDAYFYLLTGGFPFFSSIFCYILMFFRKVKSTKEENMDSKQYYVDLLPSLLLSNSYLLFFQLDKIILGTRSSIEIGYYALSERIMLILFPVIMSLILVNMPNLSRMYISSKGDYDLRIKSMLSQLYLIVIPLSVMLFWYSKQIILFVGGESFIDSDLLFKIFSITLIAMAIWRFYSSCIFYATSNEWACFKIVMVGGCANLLIKMFMQIDESVTFISITLFLHLIIIFIFIFYSSVKLKIKTPRNISDLVKYFLLILASILVSEFFDFGTIWYQYGFVVNMITTIVVYFGVLLYFKDKNLIGLLK